MLFGSGGVCGKMSNAGVEMSWYECRGTAEVIHTVLILL